MYCKCIAIRTERMKCRRVVVDLSNSPSILQSKNHHGVFSIIVYRYRSIYRSIYIEDKAALRPSYTDRLPKDPDRFARFQQNLSRFPALSPHPLAAPFSSHCGGLRVGYLSLEQGHVGWERSIGTVRCPVYLSAEDPDV